MKERMGGPAGFASPLLLHPFFYLKNLPPPAGPFAFSRRRND